MLQDGQIPVGLYGKAQSVRQCGESLVQFLIGAINRSAAIHVRWRTKFVRDRIQRHSFAHHFVHARDPRTVLLPFEVWREGSWVYVFEFAGRRIIRMAHRTFAITRVRSSASGALCVNQSTSRRITSAISGAEDSWCCSISFISRVVPNNWPSLFIVSAIPSEWNTRMFPDSSVTPHSS